MCDVHIQLFIEFYGFSVIILHYFHVCFSFFNWYFFKTVVQFLKNAQFKKKNVEENNEI